MRIFRLVFSAIAALVVLESPVLADCADLMRGKFADTEIRKAEPVPDGAFKPASDDWGIPPAAFRQLPAFCRVVGVIRPTADSEIGFELWLPGQWNNRYLQVGNGGFAGSITYGGMIQGLRNDFAVVSTDDGHVENLYKAGWALGHLDKVIDYGYRAVHLTSVTARQIVSAYYSRKVSYAYFSGCSGGGREGLMEAQRYPDDFDGWIVGAPANDWTGLMTYFLNLSQIAAAMKEPLVPSQIVAMSKAALARCDAADGVTDGVIEEPLRCPFDPAELQCKGAPDGQCLSKAQIEAARRIYDDSRDARTHASLAPGFQGVRGAEVGQWEWLIGPVPKNSGFATTLSQLFSQNFWPFMVYSDPKVDFTKLDLLQASKDGRSRTGMILNSMDPDLATLRASGKKIIQYHGWADAVIPAQYSTAYYEAVERYLRSDNRDFYRLFMVPGLGHCGGGPGPNAFGAAYDPGPLGAAHDARREFDPEHHLLSALVRWVEKGQAPERIVATKYQNDDPGKEVVRTRPLCVYPRVARWTGRGSTDEARNFVCSTRRSTGSHRQPDWNR